jgi:hypothetical protein
VQVANQLFPFENLSKLSLENFINYSWSGTQRLNFRLCLRQFAQLPKKNKTNSADAFFRINEGRVLTLLSRPRTNFEISNHLLATSKHKFRRVETAPRPICNSERCDRSFCFH